MTDDGVWTTALITGASSGIGERFAHHLAADGTDLIVVARREERLRALAEELTTDHGVEVEVLAADLTDADDLARVEARLADGERPVELLINNAGFGTFGAFHELDGERETQELRLNCLAVLRLTHAALAPMVAAGRGAVLNVSSAAGFQPLPFNATYAATKAFVTSLSEALHEEVRGTGVTVTALCPGFVRTEFQDKAEVDVGLAPDVLWMEADEVVEAGLAGLGRGDAVVVPGIGYKVLSSLVRVTPRWAVRRMGGVVTRRL